MISMKYDRIKSYYQQSAISEKKGWNRMSFYNKQELSETLNFRKYQMLNILKLSKF